MSKNKYRHFVQKFLTSVRYIDNSGKLNINDVLITQQYIAGWDVKVDYYGADANGDGRININDVLLAQQKIAGWDVTLF